MCKSRSNIVIGIAAGIALFLAISCSKQGKVVDAKSDSVSTSVAVAKAAREDLSHSLVLAAEFRAYQDIDVHAKVAGFVKEIYVDVGDRVQKGQVLALLEIPELVDELNQVRSAEKKSELDVARAKGDLQHAESAAKLAQLSYSRLSSVVKLRPNLVAQQELDDAQAKDEESKAQVAASKATLGAAEEAVRAAAANQERVESLLSYAKITAPFTGVITKRYADVGGLIQSGVNSQTQTEPVVNLAQNDRMRLILRIPESTVPRIHVGRSVDVSVPSLNRTFKGTVSRFAYDIKQDTRTMHTEVDVPNPDLVLMPGMYAYATLTLDQREGALAVPIQAVSLQGSRGSVLIVGSGNRLEERDVTVGIQTPTKVEVLGGLKEGDLVVIGNRDQSKPGDVVQPKLLPVSGE
jgi:RND family efflux transporter MFP subunit